MSPIDLEDGTQIPEIKLSPSALLDKTTVIYGPSGTGKTVVVKDGLKKLNDYVEQIVLVSPTEPSNRAYEGFVDRAFTHYQLGTVSKTDKKDTPQKAAHRFLEAIFQRQEMMAAIYTRANRVEVLSKLYGRLSKGVRRKADKFIASLERKRRRVLSSLKRRYAENVGMLGEKVEEANEKFEKMLSLLLKKYLTPHVDALWKKKGLTEDEFYSLKYIHFNPRLLLLFDDCAAQLKPFFNKEIFRKLFYQNRHSFITVIICCQDDTDLPTNLRKNAFISIFTAPIVATSNFERPSNKFPKATKLYVASILSKIFVGHRKLVYIREDDRKQHFYHLTSPYPKKSMFGSRAIRSLCDDLRSEGVMMDKNNPYYEKFKVF